MEDAVLAAVDGAYASWRECARSVSTCDPTSLTRFRTGRLLQDTQARLAEWQANFYEAVNVDSYTYEVLELSLDTDPVFVVVCQSDASVLLERRPGEAERVIEEGHEESIRETHMALTPEGWKVEAFATRERVEGEVGALCG